jgi:hypothetical protein
LIALVIVLIHQWIQLGKKSLPTDEEFRQLDSFCHDLVRYGNQASGIQTNLPTFLKHGGETRPWRSLSAMFSSVSKSRDALFPLLRAKKKEQLVARIDVDLLNDVVFFLDGLPSLFDIIRICKHSYFQKFVACVLHSL